ncbi:hypothetical protein CY35_13G080900 [Sphagnum magellanicum]|nr:hypothetical protein CY35_13G080900 [Sphagnum magellanicum]
MYPQSAMEFQLQATSWVRLAAQLGNKGKVKIWHSRKGQTFLDYQATNIQTVSSGQLKFHVGGMRTCPP